MRLDVLGSEAIDDVARICALADQAYADFCCAGLEPETIDLGTAVCTPEFSRVFDANRVFHARIPTGMDAKAVWQSTHDHYARHGSRCWRIMPARLAPESETAPLIELMEGLGWREINFDILRLQKAPVLREPRYRVVSARAAMKQYETFAHLAAASVQPQLADVSLRRLDDPRYDALVALHDGKVVARAALMTSGEVGLIEQVRVLDEYQGKGLGRAVTEAAIELCIRSQFRYVVLTCEPGNTIAQSLYRSLGFEKIGVSRAWHAPADT